MTTDDETRFTALFAAHRAAVLAYARRRVGDEGAADVVAETFLVAWRRLDAVPGDPLPWLYGVARRVIANQRRAEHRTAALQARIAGEPGPRAHGPDLQIEARDELRAAFAALGEHDREALRLVAWEGLSPRDAARTAGCSRATFAVRLHRARRRLQAALSPDRANPLPREVPHEA